MLGAALDAAKAKLIAMRNDAIVRLALKRAGMLACRHHYRLIVGKRRLYLKCDRCDRETQGFVVEG